MAEHSPAGVSDALAGCSPGGVRLTPDKKIKVTSWRVVQFIWDVSCWVCLPGTAGKTGTTSWIVRSTEFVSQCSTGLGQSAW